MKGKGRNPCKQYMPKKPIQRGTKIWCAACTKSGYIWDFQIYTQKSNQTEKFVTSVLNSLDNENRIVFCDNFFTSVELADDSSLKCSI